MRTLTSEVLAAAVRTTPDLAARWVEPILRTWDIFSIDTLKRRAPFLAHVGHESDGLQRVVESLNYRADRLVPVFGRHRITQEQARLYGRSANRAANQEAIANIVYGGAWGLRNLGNTEPGDGWKYRGRDPIQTTGKANYTRARDGLRKVMSGVPDFVEQPHLLELPEWGALAAGLFWSENGLNALADAGDIEAQTLAINGGDKGLAERSERLDEALDALS